MLQALLPDGDGFRDAYPQWLERASRLIAESDDGVTFGVFGPWGSGKTSATKALQNEVRHKARAPLRNTEAIAVAHVDCSALQSATAEGLANSVHTELTNAGSTESSPDWDKRIFGFLRRAVEVVKAGVSDPLHKGMLEGAAAAAAYGETLADAGHRARAREIPEAAEKAFVFLDDLDRCDADIAWAILRQARVGLPTNRAVFAIVCDPVILGHHISHALGVPLANGFQAVLKYIDSPLRIPTALTDSHKRKIQPQIAPDVGAYWRLDEVASEAVGTVPIRDVLVALPQASFWLGMWQGKLRPSDNTQQNDKLVAEVVFFLSLVQACVPNAASVIGSMLPASGEFKQAFSNISQGTIRSMKDSNLSAIQFRFGSSVQEVLESRMDIVHYGRSRQIGEATSMIKVGNGRRDLWEVLWNMLRD